MAGKSEERKCANARGTAPVCTAPVAHARCTRSELNDHSVFRRLAQEAPPFGQQDGGPVAGPGQPAAHRSRDGRPD
ncbi:hypothetical protein DF034_04555 [Burkholderia anthina]|nr:hypothetical protein DF034_04555 [Burkholderia anthina]